MVYLYVGIGGIIGSILRFLIANIPFPNLGDFPIGTLTVNLIGSFALAWFTGIMLCKPILNPEIKTGISTGIVGSFTTFSTLSLEAYQLYQGGLFLSLGIYLFLTIIGGLGLTIVGLRIGNRFIKENPI
ncbi:fluoride efflux transporter FluC [Pseudoneobacillus sp. C159]